jgi:hypothetical protein
VLGGAGLYSLKSLNLTNGYPNNKNNKNNNKNNKVKSKSLELRKFAPGKNQNKCQEKKKKKKIQKITSFGLFDA